MPKKKENLSPEERLAKAIIPKEEEPYKIPDNWVWTRLGNVIILLSGQDISSKLCNSNKIGIPYILGASNIADDIFTAERWIENPKTISLKDDLLLSVKGTIGKLYLQKEDKINISRQIMSLRPYTDCLKVIYLKYFLECNMEKIKKEGNGLIPGISRDVVLNRKIPLPPLNEQKRIVEKLDSLFEKTGKIKEIIEEVKEKTSLRREAVLSKAFTGELTEKWRAENKTENAKELLLKINEEKLKNNPKAKIKDISEMLVNEDEIPYKVPENWVWTRLGDIANILNGDRGKNYPAKNKLSEKGEIPFISASNLEDGKILTENLLFLSDEQYEKLRAGKLQENDLLFCIRGSLGKYGKNYFSQGAIASSLVIIRNFLQNQEAIEYIGNYFKTILLKNEIAKYNNGTAQPNLSAENLKKFLLPLPPIEEQKEISRILDKVFEEENKISELISLENKIEILEKTILDKAFRGELGTGNTDDEPALELLKKIFK